MGGGGNAKKGMESTKIGSIADRLLQAQHDLKDASSAADKAIRVLRPVWTGEDAKAFFKSWPHLKHSLEQGVTHVSSLEKSLREQIGEQELTSGVRGAGGDSDGDGIPDKVDRDDDNDDTPDSKDTDDDNDGTPDNEEKDGKGGVKNEHKPDPFYDKHHDNDTDGDGTRDSKDTDDDNDGTPDSEDGDKDNDGTPDDKDDSDDRGTNPLDEDNDGTPDTEDSDDDNDGTPDSEDPEHKKESNVEAEVRLAHAEKELWDKDLGPEEKTWGDEDGTHAKVDVLSTEGKAEAEAGISKDGVTAAAGVTASATLASASAQYKNAHGTTANVSATVGAEANAQGGVSLGKDGLKAEAGVDAFAGGKLEASVSQEIGPVEAGASGEISYGIGFEASAEGEFSKDRVGFSVDLNATLGIGAGGEINIGFDPPDIDLPDIDMPDVDVPFI
jgi:uncharacterized protein YukE